ncbi:MAG: efflux RND transporter periplasmic adaptor subunit [Verrucomicrobia bacterium]|nr:efflux RND transporter periplasmic adaptor subunit [Verrucomicrobiota bacterium]
MKMNTKTLSLLLAIPILGAIGYAVWRSLPNQAHQAGGRKILFYQDSMHPWIKSDKPGKCTVCNMDLTPIPEGEKGFGVSDGTVVLSSNSVTVLHVQAEEVKRRPLYRTLRVAGTLEADEGRKAIIAAPAPALVETVSVNYTGAEVEHGQTLVTLFSPDLSQKSRYLRAATTLSNTLSQTKGRSDFFSANLLAPLSGTVTERAVVPGQYVVEGEKLLTIVDASVLWFRFDVYERQLPWFQTGQRIAVQVPAVPGTVFPAVISFIEPTINDATRTVKVRADIKNPIVGTNGHPQRLLRFGMYAEAVVRAQIPNVLAVPRAAVLLPGGAAYAYVEESEGAYERRRVQLGRQGDDVWEVLDGLDEGDRVVTSGNVLIDAQAQFNQSGPSDGAATDAVASAEPAEAPMMVHTGLDHPAAPAAHDSAASGPSRTPAQEAALTNFLAVADGISQALAADNLGQLKQHLALLPKVVPSLSKELGAEESWRGLLQRLSATAQWPAPADLAGARKSFLPFSTNVVALVQQLRGQEQTFRSLKVYHCPMAPKPGLWFQAKGPLRNPYYGAEMLTCGEEVRPVLVKTPPPSEAPMAPVHSATTQLAAATAPTPPSGPTVNPRTGSRADRLYGNTARVEEMRAKRWAAMAAANTRNMADLNTVVANQPPQESADAGMGLSAAKPGATNPASILPLMPRERQVIEEFVATVDGLSLALASDDLEKFNRTASKLPGLSTALTLEFRAYHRWGKLVERIVATSTHPQAKNLDEARKYFVRFSAATVEWVKQLRKEERAFATLKVYHCPQAPAPGLWIQAQGPLRNPFCGAAMLESGNEVPPETGTEERKAAASEAKGASPGTPAPAATAAGSPTQSSANAPKPSTSTAVPQKAAEPTPSVAPAASAQPGLTPVQRQALQSFLAVADGISQALAADNLAQWKKEAAKLSAAFGALTDALGASHPWREALQKSAPAGSWEKAADLAAARKEFLPFSTSVVALVTDLRKQDAAFQSLKIYQCPMAPKPGLWFQAKGPLRNPYFGAEMLTCGKEVKP